MKKKYTRKVVYCKSNNCDWIIYRFINKSNSEDRYYELHTDGEYHSTHNSMYSALTFVN